MSVNDQKLAEIKWPEITDDDLIDPHGLLPEDAQQQHDRDLSSNPKLASKDEFLALMNEPGRNSSATGLSGNFDPIAVAMQNHPGLSRDEAEEMAKAFGF